jgi:hypothetical protein
MVGHGKSSACLRVCLTSKRGSYAVVLLDLQDVCAIDVAVKP